MTRAAPKKPDSRAIASAGIRLPAAVLSRRELGRSLAGLGLAAIAGPACTTGRAAAKPADSVSSAIACAPRTRPALRGEVSLWSCFDLPDDPRSRELSGAAWDAETRTLWAVQDERATIVPLRPDADLRHWTFGEPIRLAVPGSLDLEGIVLSRDGFFLVSEIGPRIIEVDRAGRFRRDMSPPPKFAEALRNKSFESLTIDPERGVLYTTSETALPRDDGAIAQGSGPRVRIVRADLAKGTSTEHAYATDEVVTGGGDYGVADLAALGNDDLLVLERGFRKGIGNAVRIYRVDLADAASACDGIEQLSPSAAVLQKTLFVDLATLSPEGASAPKQPQPTPLMENYEGMTLGPDLPDGRASLVLVSDDNGRATQTPRVVVLAVR